MYRGLIKIFLVLSLSVGVSAQASLENCFGDPVTITVATPNSTAEPKLEEQLEKAKADLEPDEKLFIYVYATGEWGTAGITTFSTSVANFTKRFLKENQYEINEGGYRYEASVELFRLNDACQLLVESEYKGEPGMTVAQVDFSIAPLGLSVFPKDIYALISKYGEYDCMRGRWMDICRREPVSFDVIVGTNGRVIYARPLGKQNDEVVLKIARDALENTVFELIVIDGTPRFIRGQITISHWSQARKR